jgi:hypothetical protein
MNQSRLLGPHPIIHELAGGNPPSGAPLRLGDVVLQILTADAPHAALILPPLPLLDLSV